MPLLLLLAVNPWTDPAAAQPAPVAIAPPLSDDPPPPGPDVADWSAIPPFHAAPYASADRPGPGVGVLSVEPALGSTVPSLQTIVATFDRPFTADQLTTNTYNGVSGCQGADSVLLVEYDLTYSDGAVERGLCMGMDARPLDRSGHTWQIDLRQPLVSHVFSRGLGDPRVFHVTQLDARLIVRPDVLQDRGSYSVWVPLQDATGRQVDGATVMRWHIAETDVRLPTQADLDREGMYMVDGQTPAGAR